MAEKTEVYHCKPLTPEKQSIIASFIVVMHGQNQLTAEYRTSDSAPMPAGRLFDEILR